MLVEWRRMSELPNLGWKAESRLTKPKCHEIGIDANITLDVEGEQGVNAYSESAIGKYASLLEE